MSYSTTVPCTCERCGTIFEGTIWNSINVDVDPELREKLIQGKLMKFTCSGCGLEEFAPYDMLYHDMNRKFMIQLIHSNEHRNKLSSDPLDEVDEEFQNLGYIFRLVGTYNQLLEKIFIFENDLNDIVIEFNKNSFLEKEYSEHIELRHEELYFSHIEENKGLVFIRISEDDPESQMLSLQMQSYNSELDKLHKLLEQINRNEPHWMIVDYDFTISNEIASQGYTQRFQPKNTSLWNRLRNQWRG